MGPSGKGLAPVYEDSDFGEDPIFQPQQEQEEEDSGDGEPSSDESDLGETETQATPAAKEGLKTGGILGMLKKEHVEPKTVRMEQVKKKGTSGKKPGFKRKDYIPTKKQSYRRLREARNEKINDVRRKASDDYFKFCQLSNAAASLQADEEADGRGFNVRRFMDAVGFHEHTYSRFEADDEQSNTANTMATFGPHMPKLRSVKFGYAVLKTKQGVAYAVNLKIYFGTAVKTVSGKRTATPARDMCFIRQTSDVNAWLAENEQYETARRRGVVAPKQLLNQIRVGDPRFPIRNAIQLFIECLERAPVGPFELSSLILYRIRNVVMGNIGMALVAPEYEKLSASDKTHPSYFKWKPAGAGSGYDRFEILLQGWDPSLNQIYKRQISINPSHIDTKKTIPELYKGLWNFMKLGSTRSREVMPIDDPTPPSDIDPTRWLQSWKLGRALFYRFCGFVGTEESFATQIELMRSVYMADRRYKGAPLFLSAEYSTDLERSWALCWKPSLGSSLR